MSFVALPGLPDPAELRSLAARIDQHAGAARARAAGLGDAIAATGWHGLAARAFGAQAHVVVLALRSAAGQLEDAADALRRHADAVDGVLGTLEGIVRAGLATAEELMALPVDVLRDVGQGVDEVAALGGAAVSAVSGGVDDALGLIGL